MAKALAQFDAPPVVETVLSAQFDPLPPFTLAHAGWFWRESLDARWRRGTEVSRLNDAYERFGDDQTWQRPSLEIMPVGKLSQRLQIVRDDEERMVQVQNSRFIQNWRKRKGDYPSYRALLPEFRDYFSRFEAFVKNAQLGEVKTNQWEVVYVNVIPKGDLWRSPGDWKSIFPWFNHPSLSPSQYTFNAFANGEWQFVIGDNLGRLFVALNHVKIGSLASGQEAIQLQMTARGPINAAKGIDLYVGLDLGHQTIVEAFVAMTSESAQKYWKRKT